MTKPRTVPQDGARRVPIWQAGACIPGWNAGVGTRKCNNGG